MLDEYISRKAAIVWATKAVKDVFDAYDVKVSLQALPAADVVERPRWIPVKERLPKDEKDVLAYYGFKHDGVLSDQRFIGTLYYFRFDPNPHWQHEGQGKLTVTHWMPLPEPPKDEAPAGPYDLLYEEGGPDE